MYKYGLHEVFTVVNPFDIDGPDAGQLKSDTKGIIAIDLFDRYHSLTVDDVVQSCWWDQGFGTDESCFEEDMEYSLGYFEKNTEASLYARVYSDMLRHNKEAHGGPLFFKLLCKETSTTKESNWRAMITIIKTYQIKSSCKGDLNLSTKNDKKLKKINSILRKAVLNNLRNSIIKVKKSL